jgi:hypothetical protein
MVSGDGNKTTTGCLHSTSVTVRFVFMNFMIFGLNGDYLFEQH